MADNCTGQVQYPCPVPCLETHGHQVGFTPDWCLYRPEGHGGALCCVQRGGRGWRRSHRRLMTLSSRSYQPSRSGRVRQGTSQHSTGVIFDPVLVVPLRQNPRVLSRETWRVLIADATLPNQTAPPPPKRQLECAGPSNSKELTNRPKNSRYRWCNRA